jgi:hypothetical protein
VMIMSDAGAVVVLPEGDVSSRDTIKLKSMRII